MLCPYCRSEIPVASAVCPACNIALHAGAPLPAPYSTAIPSEPPALALRLLAVLGGVLCFAFVVLLSALAARKNYPAMNAQGLGYAVGTCIGAFLIPGIGLLIYLKVRKHKHTPAYLFAATCAFALFWSFLGIAPQFARNAALSQEDINARIARLAREGAGQAPVTPDQDEFDGIVRTFFADVKKFNEDYRAEIAATDNSSLKFLYTADSFNGEANISRMLEQLQATLAVDEKYASLQPLLQKLKSRLDASSMSESSKRDFWRGVNSSMQAATQPRDELIAKEHAWLSDSMDLYQFMRENRKFFHVKANQILFNSDELLDGYNQKLEKVQSERKEFVATKAQLRKLQQEQLGKLGLKPSDFGAPRHN